MVIEHMDRVKSTFSIKNLENLRDLSLDDFVLEGYDPHPAISAKMAI